MVLGLAAQDAGAAAAVLIFPQTGPLGMVALRLGFSAVLLLAIARPRWRGRSRADWRTVALFGLSIAAMNAAFYEALARIPLGITVTIEVLGPLVLSVVMARRLSGWLWAGLAFAGVALLGGVNVGDLDPLGVAFAFLAAAIWAGYILSSAEAGRRFERLDGLAVAMTIGAVVALPAGLATGGPVLLRPDILALGLAVAVLSSTIPYALELLALRRIRESTFGVLMSLSPALAALAGFVVLGQRLGAIDLVAIGLVITASIGAVRTAAPRAEPTG